MSSRRKIIKGCCDGSCPTFKVSSCSRGPQGEPGTSFTPVYGSLYTEEFVLATTGTNVDFTLPGPSSGVTLNTTDNSITVNNQGVYNVSFSTQISASNAALSHAQVFFQLSINGIPQFRREISFDSFIFDSTVNDTLSRTDQLPLNQGDVLRVFILFTEGTITYSNAALVVTKVA